MRGFPIVLLAAMLAASGAVAAPKPTTVDPAFTSEPSKAAVAAGPACPLNIVEIVDGRRVPDTLGVVGGKAVKSPTDSVAWLKTIVGDLDQRGYAVTFADPAAPATAISAKITLQIAWIDDVMANKTASVVLLVEATRADGAKVVKPFRGGVALVNWVNGNEELQKAVNQAFGKALDQIAIDLRPLCA